MKVDIHRQDVPWNDEAERALKRAVRQTEARAERYPQYWTELDVRIDEHDDGLDEIRITLILSGQQVQIETAGDDLPRTIREAFDELFREFDAYRLSSNRTLRERVDRRLQREPTPPGGDGVNDMMREVYPVLLRIAQHEVGVRQIEGDLEPGLVDPIEVVDIVLAKGFGAIDDGMTVVRAAQVLQDQMIQVLDEIQVDIVDHREHDVPLEREPDFAISEIGQEIQDWWLVEDATMRDVIPDPDTGDLDEVWADQERRDALTHALFRLHDSPRRLFSQVVIDGWPVDAVAAALDRDQDRVEAEIDQAAHDLAHLLSMRGTTWSADRVREVYAGLGERLRNERREIVRA